MSITNAEVEKIAHLARLAVTPEEIPTYVHHLSNILTLLDQLNIIDTSTVSPMAHPIDHAHQRMRVDAVTETDQCATLQKVAPVPTIENLYLVPQVIE